MTPQQKAMSQILQVTLFKLAEEFHTILDKLQITHPHAGEQLSQIGRDVETFVDRTLDDYHRNGRNFSIEDMDRIHSEIIQVRALLG